MTPDEQIEKDIAQLFAKGVKERVAERFPNLPDVAKPVTMDPRPAPMMRPPEDQASTTSPVPYSRGPIETLGSLAPLPGASSLPMTDRNNPSEVHQLDQARRFTSLVGSQAGGAVAGRLASAIPGVAAAAASPALLPKLASGAVTGAAGGAGATVGGGSLNPQDIVRGAGVGAGLGVAGAALGHAFQGAPAREARDIISRGGEGMKAGPYEKFFGSREGAIRTLKADNELRAALGKPDEMIAAVEQRLPQAHAEATKILDARDAEIGRIPVLKTMAVFDKAMNDLQRVGGTEKNAALDTVFNLAKQFKSGLGANNEKPPSTADIRTFLTEVIGSKLNPRPITTDDTATAKAAGLMYGKFKDLISEHAGPKLAPAVDRLNEQQATYMLLRDAAEQSRLTDSRGGSWGTKVLTTLRSAGGGTAGAMLGHKIAGAPGAVVGAAAGAKLERMAEAGARDAGEAITRGMASPGGQALPGAMAPTAKHSAHVLVPQIVHAMRSGDRPAALQATADAVYGDE
jgi:hypothetical protein